MIEEEIARNEGDKEGGQQEDGEEEENMEIEGEKTIERTYAQITRQKANTSRRKEEIQIWKSPEREERWETVIRRKRIEGEEEDNNSKNRNLKEVKKCLIEAKLEGPIKGIWETKGGGVIVQCNTEKQRETVNKAIQSREECIIKETNLQKPIMKLTGIEAGWTDEELTEELVRQNRDKLQTLVGKVAKEELRAGLSIHS